MIGLAFAQYTLVCFILHYWHAGGVKHASEIDSHHRGKNADVADSHVKRGRIDVEVRNLSLTWEKRRVMKSPGTEKRKLNESQDMGEGENKVENLGKREGKLILDDVSVAFPAGEVSAILVSYCTLTSHRSPPCNLGRSLEAENNLQGPSGAGKSTLLQLLAARQLSTSSFSLFTQTGSVTYDSKPLSRNRVQAEVAFVEQDDDWHLPRLTVRETLRYAAILRLPDKMSKKRKIARAETVLRMLGLKDCADLPVGGMLLKGISGGEKRRLSLAVQSE